MMPFCSSPSTALISTMGKKKNPAAVELGRRGGKASAEKLTNQERQAKARKAARARWTKRQKRA
jgi:hypothetical protein